MNVYEDVCIPDSSITYIETIILNSLSIVDINLYNKKNIKITSENDANIVNYVNKWV